MGGWFIKGKTDISFSRALFPAIALEYGIINALWGVWFPKFHAAIRFPQNVITALAVR